MKWLQSVKSSMDAADPRLFWLLVFAVVVGSIALFRWKLPAIWDKLPGRVQAIPAMLLAGVASGLSSAGDIKAAIVDTLLGGSSAGWVLLEPSTS